MWKDWLESFLEENYSNPYLSFKDIMDHFRFSKSYGYTLFKMYLGMTFREKLRAVRLEKAKPLIEETLLPISEIARRCGFRSPQRLTEAFRKIYGTSPSPLDHRKSGHQRKNVDV